MIIIPYAETGKLESNSQFHFHSLQEAAYWAFKQALNRGYVEDLMVWRFRILDSEEDFIVAFSKVGTDIVKWNPGWFDLCGFSGYIEKNERGDQYTEEEE